METFRKRFTKIHNDGFSTNRRIPRLGKIRLGIKVRNSKGVEFPKETDFFVVPESVQKIYGPEPRELDVLLPVEDEEIFFPQKLVMYGSSKGIKCHGDGQVAERLDDSTGKFIERTCPCEHRKSEENPRGQCDEVAHLMVILPRVNAGGIWQLTTRSYNSVVDINSGIDFVRGLIGRVAMVPLKLRREKRETHHDGKKQVHWTCTLTLDADIDGINRLREDNKRILETARYQLEAPVEESPISDPPDLIEIDEKPDEPAPAQASTGPTAQADEATLTATDMSGELLDLITEQVKELRKTKKGAEALRKLNADFAVKDYRHLPADQLGHYYQAVSQALDDLQVYA